ncbi:hypothetical protein SAMN02745947_05388 [Rhodococcus rhodochrous J3]|uniref:Uncharacterized protein n=3 Tax=Rhodococcus rhodochrous TaxID=1829 RepID=A0A562E7U5_RHORH|nr:hypothetical protein [Rhodococcus rhodochrous]MBF4476763.1 hypothetical protein [Rhodococcus rhodochrous]MCB8913921.1 hypothetical protein [Rhodococcus rhodochrous]MCD2099276.1 hypothetical protein [Rhodococcus rhodochrous]MCD2123719.1 hypothetical protein [Rhodococcus rhodochrous]MCQ4136252.1 hypothetical protein [Rhodococcus rhodochrous]
MEEPIEQLPYADWVDQDLLTRELAGNLLDEEIAAERERLARLERGERDEGIVMSRADMERRLAAMVAARAQAQGSTEK